MDFERKKVRKPLRRCGYGTLRCVALFYTECWKPGVSLVMCEVVNSSLPADVTLQVYCVQSSPSFIAAVLWLPTEPPEPREPDRQTAGLYTIAVEPVRL